MSLTINTTNNRKAVKYSRGEQGKRIVWFLLKPFFICSPRPFFGWRNFLLKMLGAKIGHGVRIYSSAVIYFPWNLKLGNYSSIGENTLIYNLGLINIGHHVTISQRAHLCAGSHDYKRKDMLLLKPPINIEDHVWICADAFVGPDVTIHEGAVIAARAVVVKNVANWEIVGGNPANFIKYRPEPI
jgi:putative colanic acid biosynthesis acetyltransferase WcaF